MANARFRLGLRKAARLIPSVLVATVVSLVVSTHHASAVSTDLDCAKTFEDAKKYADAAAFIRQLVEAKPEGIQGFFNRLKDSVEVKKLEGIASSLRSFGIDCEVITQDLPGISKTSPAIRFLPGNGHQVNRTAKFLKDHGGDLVYWTGIPKSGSAVCISSSIGSSLFGAEKSFIAVGDEDLLNLIQNFNRTTPTIRHELVHFKVMQNKNRKIFSMFYGSLSGSSITGYERFFAFDEFPAYVEQLRAAARLKGGYLDLHNAAENLARANPEMQKAFEELVDFFDRDPTAMSRIRSDEHGVYIQDFKLESGVSISVLLNPKEMANPSKEWVQRELRSRQAIYLKVRDLLASVKSPIFKKIYSDPNPFIGSGKEQIAEYFTQIAALSGPLEDAIRPGFVMR